MNEQYKREKTTTTTEVDNAQAATQHATDRLLKRKRKRK
jgi:hypothetical protein